MVLTLADDIVVKDLGQFVVTSDRIVGMMTHGSVGPVKLDGAAGSVYTFSVGLTGAAIRVPGRPATAVPTAR